ncbi:MAG TPA: hypothetical protein VMJ93_14645 [Verrucomicrobiae bacterium]|nr:hypothetical protein [Verrucomicrobiae bacterium]
MPKNTATSRKKRSMLDEQARIQRAMKTASPSLQTPVTAQGLIGSNVDLAKRLDDATNLIISIATVHHVQNLDVLREIAGRLGIHIGTTVQI